MGWPDQKLNRLAPILMMSLLRPEKIEKRKRNYCNQNISGALHSGNLFTIFISLQTDTSYPHQVIVMEPHG